MIDNQKIFSLAFLLILVQPIFTKAQSTFVLDNVHILTMDSEEVLTNYSVMISEGVIKQMAPSGEFDKYNNVKIIDGQGKYLLPGFINMYTHISRESLPLYLANGQTTVRDAPSHIAVLGLREGIKSGEYIGPEIYSIGLRATGMPAPYHSQQPTITPEEGREQVREAIRLGYDGMMIYATCSPSTYEAIMDEAKKHDFPISGHWPMYVDNEVAISGYQSTYDNFTGITRGGNLRFDEEFLIDGLKMYDKAVVPTISIHRLWATSHLDHELYESLLLEYVPTKMKASWIPDGDPSEPSTYNYGNVERLIKRMHDEGIQLFVGSDGGYPMAVHGFSFHDELQAFVDAGIPEFSTLKYATVDAARYLGKEKTGLVKEGYEADLVLLAGNPLENIAESKNVEGLVLDGKWLSKEFLDEQLEGVARNISSSRDRFAGWENYLEKNAGSEEFHYSYSSFGEQIGEEKIIIDRESSRNFVMQAVSVVDGPDFRETYAYFRINGRQIDSLSVIVKGADGNSHISAYRSGRKVIVEGEAPFHGAFKYEEPFLPGMLLLAPFTSRYFDIDILANYQLGLMLSKSLSEGQADQLPSVQIEMNSEEFGRKYIVDRFDLTVYRNKDEGENQIFTFIHPGFSGYRSLTQPSFNVKAIVRDNQAIHSLIYNDYKIELVN
ncbi:MAG: amidohydrolase family protein [Balneolaceae bacterium]|nr:amidohydrolase family protein [Balneolaceae bacterium]MBO6547829.1 amidohydrolase family protein [Balneolaceae bacterium]MBO6648340.1 amidohydrolase family protein [Balneolaceae bacterium]